MSIRIRISSRKESNFSKNAQGCFHFRKWIYPREIEENLFKVETFIILCRVNERHKEHFISFLEQFNVNHTRKIDQSSLVIHLNSMLATDQNLSCFCGFKFSKHSVLFSLK